jgi:chromosome segregation ATPase
MNAPRELWLMVLNIQLHGLYCQGDLFFSYVAKWIFFLTLCIVIYQYRDMTLFQEWLDTKNDPSEADEISPVTTPTTDHSQNAGYRSEDGQEDSESDLQAQYLESCEKIKDLECANTHYVAELNFQKQQLKDQRTTTTTMTAQLTTAEQQIVSLKTQNQQLKDEQADLKCSISSLEAQRSAHWPICPDLESTKFKLVHKSEQLQKARDQVVEARGHMASANMRANKALEEAEKARVVEKEALGQLEGLREKVDAMEKGLAECYELVHVNGHEEFKRGIAEASETYQTVCDEKEALMEKMKSLEDKATKDEKELKEAVAAKEKAIAEKGEVTKSNVELEAWKQLALHEKKEAVEQRDKAISQTKDTMTMMTTFAEEHNLTRDKQRAYLIKLRGSRDSLRWKLADLRDLCEQVQVQWWDSDGLIIFPEIDEEDEEMSDEEDDALEGDELDDSFMIDMPTELLLCAPDASSDDDPDLEDR